MCILHLVAAVAGLSMAAISAYVLVGLETFPGPNGNRPSWTALPAGLWLFDIVAVVTVGCATTVLVAHAGSPRRHRPDAR